MRLLIKIVLIIGVIFVVLLGGTAAYIKIQYPPEKLKSIATEKLSAALQRKVSVGDANFNLMTGFEIKDLKISNRPGWAAGNMVVAKDISISYHLYQLVMGYFSNQVILGEIKLNEPQILVERRGLGQFNFSDMTGDASAANAPPSAPAAATKPAPAPAKPKGKGKPKKKHAKHAALSAPLEAPASSSWFADQAWAGPADGGSKSSMTVLADSVNINHGKMTYLDETTNPPQRSELKDLNLKVKNISTQGGKTTFSLGTPFDYSGLKYELAVEGTLRYFKSGNSIKGLDVKGTVNGLGFGFAGDLLDMSDNLAPNIDGTASLNMLQFSGLIPKSLSSMPDGLSFTGPAKVTFHAGGKFKSGLELTGLADGSSLAIKYKDMFVKTDKTICTVDFKSVMSENGDFNMPFFKVLYQDWEVNGSFHYAKGSSYSGEIHSKSLPLKGLPGMLPKLSKTTVDGSCVMDATYSQNLNQPGSFKANGQAVLKGVGITLPQESYLQEMNGTIYLNGLMVRAPSTTFKSFDGTGVTGVTMNLGVKPYPYSYAFNLKNVNAQKAINASADAYVVKSPEDYKDKLFGTMNMVYQGSGRGFSAAEMEASALGSGNYTITSAKVKGYSAIKTINGIFGDQGDSLGFDKIVGTLAVKSQVCFFKSDFTSKVGSMQALGGINFSNVYTPDMKVFGNIHKQFLDSDLIKSKLPPGTDVNCIADSNGDVPVDFRFTGPVKDNNWSYDWNRLLKNVGDCIGKKAQQAIQQKAQDLGKDLGDKLKGLFGK